MDSSVFKAAVKISQDNHCCFAGTLVVGQVELSDGSAFANSATAYELANQCKGHVSCLEWPGEVPHYEMIIYKPFDPASGRSLVRREGLPFT